MTGAIGVLIVWPTRAPIFACLTEIKPATKIVLLVGSVQQTKLFAHTPSETSGTGISLTSAATREQDSLMHRNSMLGIMPFTHRVGVTP